MLIRKIFKVNSIILGVYTFINTFNNMNDFWNEQLPPGYYDKILEIGLSKNRGIQPNWHHSTFSYLGKLIEINEKHLDYACGPGTFIGKYTKAKSIGVDISKKQIDYAIDKYGKESKFLVTDDFNYQEFSSYFDKVSIIGLFEYLKDDEVLDLLDKIFFMLAKDGKVFITTPNYKSFMSILDKIVNKFSSIDYKNENINKFDKNKINELILKSEFKKIKVEKIINSGVFFGLFSFDLSQKIQNIIYKISSQRFGYLLLITLEK